MIIVQNIFLLGLLALFIGASSGAYAQGTATLVQDELLGIKQDTKWHGFVSSSYSRNQDEFSDGFYSTTFQVSYDLKPSRQVYASIGYSRPDTKFEDAVYRWGFSDLSVGITEPMFKLPINASHAINGIGFAEVSLPTSDRSRRSSNQGSGTAGLAMNTMYKRVIFTTSHSFTYNLFQYETDAKVGGAYNQPYMVANGTTAIWRVTDRLNWANGYSFAYLENFAGTVIRINSLRSSVTYIYSPKISFGGFTRWRDRLVSNNQLFDDDTTVSGGFVRYIF